MYNVSLWSGSFCRRLPSSAIFHSPVSSPTSSLSKIKTPTERCSSVPGLKSCLQNGVQSVSHFKLVSMSLGMKYCRVLVPHHGTYGAMPEFNMSAVGHIGKNHFCLSHITCSCDTSKVASFGTCV